jgi:hypothetical protein
MVMVAGSEARPLAFTTCTCAEPGSRPVGSLALIWLAESYQLGDPAWTVHWPPPWLTRTLSPGSGVKSSPKIATRVPGLMLLAVQRPNGPRPPGSAPRSG